MDREFERFRRGATPAASKRDDIYDTIAHLPPLGAALLGDVAQYENMYRLCYLRGPEGTIIALAEQIG